MDVAGLIAKIVIGAAEGAYRLAVALVGKERVDINAAIDRAQSELETLRDLPARLDRDDQRRLDEAVPRED